MSTLSRHEGSIRIGLTLIALLSGIFWSPWIALACMIMLAFAYTAYEVLFIGLVLDFLWHPIAVLHPLPLFTIVAILSVWLLEPIRSQLLS